MQEPRTKTLAEIFEEDRGIKITKAKDLPEIKELLGNGYTNNRAGKRKREKELKRKGK